MHQAGQTSGLNYYGFMRAKVIDNKDVKKFGRVKVWIPDLMPGVSESKGLWARAANSPLGGRNNEGPGSESHYAGCCFIPKIGSWVWLFFECGNINRPYYFGSLEIENEKVLPENQLGDNYEDKWTVIKTHAGRCIIVSDDETDERVEITGKKRQIKEPPSGDIDSVYEIDGNQTTILLDERKGKEKILIRSYKGDFVHFDVDEQQLHINFESDIHIKSSKGSIYIQGDGINIKSTSNLNLQSVDDINAKAGQNMNISSIKMNVKSSSNISNQADGNISSMAGGIISADGTLVSDQSGLSQGAQSASNAEAANPSGERDT